jgi:hypothetical protein
VQDRNDVISLAVVHNAALLPQHVNIPQADASGPCFNQRDASISISNHGDQLSSLLPIEIDAFPLLKASLRVYALSV